LLYCSPDQLPAVTGVILDRDQFKNSMLMQFIHREQ